MPLRDHPLLVRKDSFDELNLLSETHKFVQDGKIEVNFWFFNTASYFIMVLLIASDTL